MTTTEKPELQERVARAWASIDGNLEAFERGKAGDDEEGRYMGYMADTEELIERANLTAPVTVNKLDWTKTVDRINCGYIREQWHGTCGGVYYLIWNYDEIPGGENPNPRKGDNFEQPFHLTAGTFGGSSYFRTIEEAKAAAQADFERRARSLFTQPEITTTPSNPSNLDNTQTIAGAARVLLEAHTQASRKPASDRTPLENALANMGRNRLKLIAEQDHPND